MMNASNLFAYLAENINQINKKKQKNKKKTNNNYNDSNKYELSTQHSNTKKYYEL
jgi:hypothetical protein